MANVVVFGALFVYYAVLEGIFGASVGKLVFRMRVVMADGSEPTGVAVVVRNLCASPRHGCCTSPPASRAWRANGGSGWATTRRAPWWCARLAAAGGAFGPPAPPARRAAGLRTAARAGAPPDPAWAAAPAAPPVAAAPSVDESLAQLKTAALAARGAHLNYLRFSERELAAATPDPAGGYSEEYVGAWFTLADAVTALRAAWDAAAAAAVAAGRTLDEVSAGQADLAHLLRELTPYASAETDEEIHAAFLAVARWESSAP